MIFLNCVYDFSRIIEAVFYNKNPRFCGDLVSTRSIVHLILPSHCIYHTDSPFIIFSEYCFTSRTHNILLIPPSIFIVSVFMTMCRIQMKNDSNGIDIAYVFSSSFSFSLVKKICRKIRTKYLFMDTSKSSGVLRTYLSRHPVKCRKWFEK